ncbi:CBS domain-containing protein [Deinococcus aquaedulcis]|uniref:CBS domain-containing protein n=1 Tax=Deinococcus aquaedulcis TaxID=2840455 RepID=UPI001C838471|nr:CBS domain-containing protein [Deinococcus aquaedulcis]
MTMPTRVQDAMHPRAVTVSPHDPLPSAVVTMEALEIKRLPVVQDGRVVGIVTDGEVRRALPTLTEGLSPWAFTARVGRACLREIMRAPVHTVTPETPLRAALQTMLDRRVGGLPVVNEDGEPLGMLTLTDILRAEVRAPRLHWGLADQHMTRTVVTTAPDAPAAEAAAKLKVTRLRVLPVVDGEQLVGVLHEKDIAAAIDRAGASHGPTVLAAQFVLGGVTVLDLMRPPTGYLMEGVPLHDAVRRMLDLHVRGLPIITQEGELLGVLTISDVIRAVLGQPQTA